MIEEQGRAAFSGINALNIPIVVSLSKTIDEGTDEKTGTWTLSAANLCSRLVAMSGDSTHISHAIDGGAYVATGSREELIQLIRNHIIPVYQSTLRALEELCDPGKETIEGFWPMVSPLGDD